MQCPVDGTTLVLSERQGVEIDYCPQCRGVWLDRGELDKLIQRDDDDDDYDRWRQRDQEYAAPRHPKKRRLLSEIFDFD
jgi:Zn-finger nucleic acid-binding protein